MSDSSWPWAAGVFQGAAPSTCFNREMAMRKLAILMALVCGVAVSGLAFAGSGKDNPSDGNNGGGNQPHAPGQTTNPNPGK
jgi:hypothetical protein